MVLLNGILLTIAIIGNIFIQAFCNPTKWAIPVIIICFANSIFYPILIKKKKYIPIISLINGISLCLFIYCIIFLEHLNFLGIIGLLVGIGFLTYIPHFFVAQILWKGFIKLQSRVGKIFFLIGILISFSLLITSGILYKKALSDIEDFKLKEYQILNKTFMTEKILGMGIIYHTRFCEFDGWRPPKHEPILNLGLWLNRRKNLLDISLEKRVDLYKEFFPNNKLKYNCSCAISYRNVYHNDKLWK